MTQLVMNASPRSSKSSPQGLVVPEATTSKRLLDRMIAPDAAVEGERSASGVPGLPTCELERMPLQP